ncbi:MAG: C45 family autoproteolytic acyltransferase/hydrolase, partial [Polynucleobacter victoriensis]
MKRINLVLLAALISGTTIAVIGCGGGSSSNSSTPATVQKQDGYYNVTLDFTNTSHREVGRQYALAIQKNIPDYESKADAFLASQMAYMGGLDFATIVSRAQAIYTNIDTNYQDEISGMQDVFNYSVDKLGDGKLSKNELLAMQFFDAFRAPSCSAAAAFGAGSLNGKAVVGRNVDWMTASSEPWGSIHSITTFKYSDKSIANIGVVGMLGAFTAFNQNKVFAAMLDGTIGAAYPTDLSNKRSYLFDLRHALETYTTKDEVVNYMTSESRSYAVNHLIFIADELSVGAIENMVVQLPPYTHGNRSLRVFSSMLNADVMAVTGQSWNDVNGNPINGAFAVVNDYRLPGNYFTNEQFNKARWTSYKTQLQSKISGGNKIDAEGMKAIVWYTGPNEDGIMYNGAVFVTEPRENYTSTTQYAVPDMPNARPPAYTTIQS